MKLIPLASGSSGNSYYIRHNGNSLLVDAGLSGKQIGTRLESAGVDPRTIDAIIVSHGHSDHVKGVGVLSRKYRLPVWMNKGTWRVVERYVGKPSGLEFFETGRIFSCAGFTIHPFSVPHDCADPVGFRISRGNARLGVATDLGAGTGLVTNLLSGVQVVILESNHDPDMLMKGPYPWELKQRVRSRRGHLSNADSAGLLQRIISDELQAVVLAHMSETNNSVDLALREARNTLKHAPTDRSRLICAGQHEIGPEIEW